MCGISDSPAWDVGKILAFIEESVDARATPRGMVVDDYSPDALQGLAILQGVCRQLLKPLDSVVVE